MDAETIRFVREEIRRQLNIILPGTAGKTSVSTETINDLYPGMPSIQERPIMHPYGLVSRAPQGTLNVTGRMGDHVGNRMVLGHRDKNRPSLEEGEVILYNEFGQQIYLQDGEIHIGSKTAASPFVLGDVLNAFLKDLLTDIVAHTHAAPGAPPTNAADFTTLKSENLDNDAILSGEVFGE